MTESQARESICRIGQSLFERGYVHATAGNISVRLDDGFLITPTDACLGRLDPGDLARVDLAGQVQGTTRPSKTLLLHRQIYAAACAYQAATRCIIHTHSTHCVAQSLRVQGAERLEPITPYFVMKVGHVPLLPYRRPGSPIAAADVVEAIHRYGKQGTPLRAVMLPRLGPNVWHDHPEAAMAILEELEETARLQLLVPDTPPLTPEAIEELRQSFSAVW